MKSVKMITRLVCVMWAVLLWSCSSTRHVPQGSYLVDHVKIDIADHPKDVASSDLTNYLRQTPNHKVLGFLKLQLATYNMSGRDSSKWYNRWLRRMGQPPVIYDQTLTDASVNQLRLALINRGYMDATVWPDTTVRHGKKKIDVTYNIVAGEPHRISSITYDIPDSAVSRLIMRDSLRFTLRPGDLLNRDELDTERTLMAERLRNRGYYAFSKEYITFYADTVAGSKDVALTLTVRAPQTDQQRQPNDSVATASSTHDVYRFGKVVFITDYNLGQTLSQAMTAATDTIEHRGYTFLYGKDHWLTPGTLEEKTFIVPGRRYSSRAVDMTYEYLSRLGIVKSINIDLRQSGTNDDGEPLIDAYILLTRNKKQGITFDIEGTNSEGDFGFGAGLTYQHRNLAHRSRLLTVKFRASYESLSGNLEGLINNNYQEYAGEVGVTFPKFAFPFLSGAFKKRIKASTELAVSFDYQERPEYTRIIVGAAWKYRWGNANNLTRRTLDLVNINYVRLPKRTLDFLDQIAPTNPLLRYSYEDHFIMDIGYSFYHTNRRLPGTGNRRYVFQPLVYTIRASAETAGNLLRAYSAISGQRRSEGVYKVFGIQYSQYAKAEIDYSIVRNFTPRHSLAFHVGGGIGVPYGNSTALPFEKRFYAGGANGVRGWSVRTLGPGKFDGRNRVTDFINQCGDIMLLLNAEYRAKLFWILEGALFIDAGNIWTIRDYENQPGGVFRIGEFYKQIAASYGLGIRFDFTYFLLRLDLGFKAVNPAMNQERWPIIHPNWHRDATFHFAVGYPF